MGKGRALWTALKLRFGSRQGLSGALFLVVLALGSLAVLGSELEAKTACAGYLSLDVAQLQKRDPALPERTLEPAGSRVMGGAAPQPSLFEQAEDYVDRRETAVDNALKEQHGLIELYGGVQRAMGRTFVEDQVETSYGVAKLADGALTFVGQGDPDPTVQAAELKRLQLALEDRDIPLLYLQAPMKVTEEETLPYGVTDDSSRCADRLLAALDEAGIAYLDFRETLSALGGTWTDWFYTTDHHWNQTGAFAAFRALCGRMMAYRPVTAYPGDPYPKRFSFDDRLLDAGSYDKTVLRNAFLGSQGKRVGSLYGGLDDVTLWTPSFPTLLRYQVPSMGMDRHGALSDSLLFYERLEELDRYEANPYTFYSGGDYPIAWITNYYNPKGPRILLVRDSYACALTPYLALASSRLTTIDPRYFTGDLLRYVDQLKPDLVLVMYSGGMARDEDSFRLLPQPGALGKGSTLRWETTLRREEGPGM